MIIEFEPARRRLPGKREAAGCLNKPGQHVSGPQFAHSVARVCRIRVIL